jgi:hypothetical protein
MRDIIRSVQDCALRIAAVLLAIMLTTSCEAGAASSRATPPKSTAKAIAFHDAMRKLWEDHVIWTRQFIVSAAADLPDKGPATDRLLKNQNDIGDAIKPYYGSEAGQKLTKLLREHITIAAEIVTAAKASDAAKQEDATKRWFTNADEIAAFLSAANARNWAEPELKAMMHDHLKVTSEEVTARLKGDWSADIAAYERVHEQILHMADMLSDGIIRQFPAKF